MVIVAVNDFPLSPLGSSTMEVMLAVPLQVAVPLDRVAVNGAAVYPLPGVTIVIAVPRLMVLVPVRVTDPVAPLPAPFAEMKLSEQVSFCAPVIVPPELYVALVMAPVPPR